jgi:DNA-directed RNA polymerase subunit L
MPSDVFASVVRDAVHVVRGGRKAVIPCRGRIEFEVHGVDVSYVNGLRRSMIGDVVTAAVAFDPNDPDGQDVTISHNTGVLHNEFIGTRVSLTPLHLTRAELAALRPDSVTLSLDVSNADSDQPLDVTSRDIRVSGGGLDGKRVFPPDPVTGDWPLIAVLMPHGASDTHVQRLAFKARVSLGNGRDHARYSPVAACAVVPLPDPEKIARARAAAKASDLATFNAIEAPHLWKTAPDGAHPAAFKVSFESVSGVPPDDLVAMGFEAMATRMLRIAEKLGDPESPDVDDEPPMPNSPGVFGVKIKGETETAGALLQAHLLGEDAVKVVPASDGPGGPGGMEAPGPSAVSPAAAASADGSGSCDFCGYFTPHPLQPCIIVRYRSKEPGGPEPRELIRNACLSISVKAQQLADDWTRAAGLATPERGDTRRGDTRRGDTRRGDTRRGDTRRGDSVSGSSETSESPDASDASGDSGDAEDSDASGDSRDAEDSDASGDSGDAEDSDASGDSGDAEDSDASGASSDDLGDSSQSED